jgi:hypothetical protein
VRIATPLGEYPFQLKRVERRDGGLAVVGSVAGLESTMFLEPADVAKLVAVLAAPAVLAAVLARVTKGAGG